MALIDKASLLMVPSTYEDGTLYNILPSGNKAPDETGNHNGYDQTRADFTFSRGSNLAATRVNASGLIEKGRENLLLQSNQFDTTWTNSSSTETSGQSGYDGSSNAWLLTKTAFGYIKQDIVSNNVLTFSVYAKANTFDFARIQVIDSAGNPNVFFDLSNGTIGATAGANYVDSNIESVGNGWYRLSLTSNATISQVRIYPAEASNNVGTNTGSIYIQDAQLEAGLVSTPVIRTGSVSGTAGVLENTPRIDYSSGAGALLLESQRTNLIPQSEYLGVSDWVKLGAGTGSVPTITTNYATSPEGVQNATRVQLDLNGGTSSSDQSLFYEDLGAGTGDFTRSIYIKSNSGEVDLYFGGTLSDYETITATEEWQRFDVTSTLSSQTRYFSLGLRGTTGSSDVADILVYACQYEAGSHVSSYIPTYGSAATRGADFSSDDDLTANPIAFGANDDFTLFYEGSFDDLSSTSNMIMGGGRQQLGNSYKNYWWVQNATSMRITGDAEVRLATTSMSLTDNTNHKLLVKRSGSVVDFFVDGTKLTTTQNNPNTAFTFRSLGWAYTNSVYKVSGNMKKAIVFDSALTDAECISLTS